MKKSLLILFVLLASCSLAFAQQHESHWSDFDYHDFENHALLVAFVQIDGNFITTEDNWADIEVAAFVDGICRGHMFMDDETYMGDPYPTLQLSIHYNIDYEGEEVTFKMYDHSTGMEYEGWSCNYGIFTGDEHFEVWYDPQIGAVLNFTMLYSITVSSNPEEGGTVTGGGVYDQGDECTVAALLNAGYAFVCWTEGGEEVSYDAEYVFTAVSERDLVANFVARHWTAEVVQDSMLLTGVVLIDSTEQSSPWLELGAFSGGECRGAAMPALEEGRWQYRMLLSGETGDSITFRVYDHALGQGPNLQCFSGVEFGSDSLAYWEEPCEIRFGSLYTVSVEASPEDAGTITGMGDYLWGSEANLTAYANEGYIFNNWTLDGEIVSTEPSYTFTVTESVNLTANFNIVRTYQLAQGWNWWSTNLEITLDDLKAALVEALPGTSITIQSQTLNTSYNPNIHRWNGRLNTLDVAYMYKISVVADCEISLGGMPINPLEHPITLQNGSTWIGYPLDESMAVNDAMDGFSSISGDIIQSQTNNCVFVRGVWRGSVTTLYPGYGYIFQSNSTDDRTLIFPAGTR